MRARLALVLAPPLLFACTHPAYGPSSDDRLEAAVADESKSNQSDDAIAQQLSKKSCSGDRKKLDEANQEERPDGDRLKRYMSLYTDLVQRQKEIDKIVSEHPGVEFLEDGKSASQVLDECNAVLADTRSAFDRFVREVVELPISKEFQGGREIPVARVDFAQLKGAIDSLAPDDRDSLMAKVEDAEKRLNPKRRH